MSDSPARYDRIPALGEDTEAILREIGYDERGIESLKREKVV
jgi:crotonobetainyl-CoA:carnitine CoA-transferase CaiB-like acyl-CoA transferase